MIACDQIVSRSFQGKVHPMVVKNSDYDCHHVATYYVFTPRVADLKVVEVAEFLPCPSLGWKVVRGGGEGGGGQ